MFFLDYDGTLVGYNQDPELAIPDKSLIETVQNLVDLPNTEVAIVSGRDLQARLDRRGGFCPECDGNRLLNHFEVALGQALKGYIWQCFIRTVHQHYLEQYVVVMDLNKGLSIDWI